MRVAYRTFGCKANQYDTERMRQELEARGGVTAHGHADADACVINSCTVTNQADAEARAWIRRLNRERPGIRIIVAGCSAALRAAEYRQMEGVAGVVEGHDPVQVALAASPPVRPDVPPLGPFTRRVPLAQLGRREPLDRIDGEPIGAEILTRREGATRGWLKIQDGCDRQCAFCATRLARGKSRSRPVAEVLAEARELAKSHPELVLTGIHIGHYGTDLSETASLSLLLARLLDAVPDVRFRLGSVEATEIDDLLLDLLAGSGGRVAPHLHMPLQSGADPVLRRMRRWHTRAMYRRRALEIAERMPVLELGADIITGFPGETPEDHRSTLALVEELPFTYLHVFPYSPRDGTVAADLPDPVPQRVAGERSRELRTCVREKGRAYRARRIGGRAEAVLEGDGRRGLTGDYLRPRIVAAPAPDSEPRPGARVSGARKGAVIRGRLGGTADDPTMEVPHTANSIFTRDASGWAGLRRSPGADSAVHTASGCDRLTS